MSTLLSSSTAPDSREAESAARALDALRTRLAHDPASDVTLHVDDGTTVLVPRVAADLFARVLAHLAAGEGVTVLPAHVELTTQQAADMLNVSRPYVIKLLDHDVIEYRRVGKHRRIRLESLLAYQREDDRKRRAAADELSALARELEVG